MIFGKDINYSITRFAENYEQLVQSFDCGNEVINDYLKNKANSDTQTTTFIITDNDNKRRYIENTGQEHILCIYRQCRGNVVSSSFKSVDEALVSAFCYRIKQLKEIIKDNKEEAEEKPVPDRKKPLLSEIEKLKKQQTKLYDLLEQEIYDTATFIERSKLIADKIKTAEQQLKEIDENTPKPKLKPETAISELQYVVDNFLSANSEEKNQMLHRVVNKIYYSKSTRMCLNKYDSDLTLDIDFL